MVNQDANITNGFLQTPIVGSNEPSLPKKKRNLPGNPGKFCFPYFVFFHFCKESLFFCPFEFITESDLLWKKILFLVLIANGKEWMSYKL